MSDFPEKYIAKKTTILHGDIILRKLEKKDKKNVLKWMSNPYVIQNSFVVPAPNLIPVDFATEKYSERYFEHILTDNNRTTFAVMWDSYHVGNVGIKDIRLSAGTADCFIEIGEEKARGVGCGYSAMVRLLNYAFCERNFIEIGLDVLEFNVAAIKLYEKLCFVNQNQYSWHYDEYGQYWRVTRMSLKIQDWLRQKTLSS